jgi:exodeoxyribonuclease VII large subunit
VLPRKIGIVTSLDGAALRDIINVLKRRHRNAHLVIRPTRVQGEGAAADVAAAIRAIARVPGVDVIIVGRGGGSIEDLWAFNEESVARAIFHAPVPVVSAVGHETDVTIADFVADLRAPTPSAAAELVVAAKDNFRDRIDRLSERLRSATDARVQRLSRRLHALDARPAVAGFPGRLAMRGRHAAELTHAAARLTRATIAVNDKRLQILRRQLEGFDLGRRMARLKTRLVTNDSRLAAAIAGKSHRARMAFEQEAAHLEALSPMAVLARGYAVCWTADGRRIVRSAADVAPGDDLRIRLSRGEIEAKVFKTE